MNRFLCWSNSKYTLYTPLIFALIGLIKYLKEKDSSWNTLSNKGKFCPSIDVITAGSIQCRNSSQTSYLKSFTSAMQRSSTLQCTASNVSVLRNSRSFSTIFYLFRISNGQLRHKPSMLSKTLLNSSVKVFAFSDLSKLIKFEDEKSSSWMSILSPYSSSFRRSNIIFYALSDEWACLTSICFSLSQKPVNTQVLSLFCLPRSLDFPFEINLESLCFWFFSCLLYLATGMAFRSFTISLLK